MKSENLPVVYLCHSFYYITSHAVVGKPHRAKGAYGKYKK